MEFTDQIEEVLDGLDNPTADELMLATSAYTKRDVLAVLTRRALAEGRGSGSISNPVPEAAWDIVASESQPVALFITGPPAGAEDDYLVGVVTGAPDYAPIFFLSQCGVTISPTDSDDGVLSLVSTADDGSLILRATGALGDVLVASADGTFSLNQPGVGPVFRANSEGQFAFGAAEPDALPAVPASPGAQDVVDALVALGLITQED